MGAQSGACWRGPETFLGRKAVVCEQTMDGISRWGHWSYLLLFLGATLASSTFLGLLVPGESLVLANGFLAAR